MSSSPAKPELSVIVVSYNTRDMTVAALRSVFEQTQTPFQLIVVDNASQDGSAEAIEETFPNTSHPNLVLIKEKTNHGFARAHDIALRHATAPWVLLLNPDTIVLDRALDNLLEFAKRTPEAGIWGGRTLYADNSLNPYSCWARMTLWSVFCKTAGLTAIFPRSGFFNPETYGDWQRDTENEVDIVTGCLFLMRRSDWDDMGGFDPAFHMYGEEADLCLRARAKGLRPRISPSATIVHYGGASETVAADKTVRVLKAKMELVKRHFPAATNFLGRHVFRLWPVSRKIVLGLGAALLNSASARNKARIWSEVWRRRKEWQNGFE